MNRQGGTPPCKGRGPDLIEPGAVPAPVKAAARRVPCRMGKDRKTTSSAEQKDICRAGKRTSARAEMPLAEPNQADLDACEESCGTPLRAWLETLFVQCAWAASQKQASDVRAQSKRLRHRRGPNS